VQPTDRPAGSKPLPGLYLVATPIGNLDDITLRAVKLLAHVDCIACEDTRVTGKLLTLLGIKAPPLFAYHDHNAAASGSGLLSRLRGGASVALVSDAGTPLLSDPGFPLVRDCLAAGIKVTSLPGASALLSALQLSGLPADRFLFAGFLPAKASGRARVLADLANVFATLLFYESPRRLAESLAAMVVAFGPRPAAVARELTKMFEEVRHGDLHALALHYQSAGPPKGEVVITVAGCGEPETPSVDAVDAALRLALASGSLRDAAATVAAATGLPRRDIYARAVRLSGGDAG
jgi:16S rRNA (cytidine1402-2'-O)-methyltransferase